MLKLPKVKMWEKREAPANARLSKNSVQIKNRNKKYRVYALFQFFSTGAIFLAGLSLGLVVYLGIQDSLEVNRQFFATKFVEVMSFQNPESLHVFVSLILYLAFIFWGVSMVAALYQIKNKQRSIFDLAFLFFFFVPFLSNIITLFCQVSEIVYKTPSTFVDQYKTKIDYLHELDNYVIHDRAFTDALLKVKNEKDEKSVEKKDK